MISLPDELGPVASAHRVAGGDINDAWAVELESGERLFVKTRAGAPPGEYRAEAAGLGWLGEAITVPEVVAVDETFLALRWVDEGLLDEESLGRDLAALHAAGAPGFGATPHDGPLRLGAAELPGTSSHPPEDWATFYARWRVAPLADQALERGALSREGRAAIERVCERMADLAGPPEDPARLHGDLWSGNVMGGADGRPVLVDPAAYGGHREVDLAMLRLFGRISATTLAAYEERTPLAEGHEDRVQLYQLLPLLVHAVLFGGSYGASAAQAARRYAGGG
jgi:fructosamine-3-kinase